jgi:signal transduction histidine kinase
MAAYKRAVETGEPFDLGLRCHTATGRLFWARAIGRPTIRDGKCIRMAGTFQDITEHKRAEEEVRRLNAELEQRVKERTAMLEAANQELESFSYSVSHDLRAPLRAVTGFAEIVARRHRANLNEEGCHYVDNIVLASQRMGRLIDDLLEYSRVGRRAVRRQPLSLRDVLDAVLSQLAGQLKETGADLIPPAGLPVIPGEATLLNQILTNLIGNALAYHRPGVPPRIVLACREEADHVLLSVADNGIGIPAEHHERIFNVFQRLHSDDEYPGTGIGLAIVKKAVDLLGGRVWVESVVGQGSTFWVKLPCGPNSV